MSDTSKGASALSKLLQYTKDNDIDIDQIVTQDEHEALKRLVAREIGRMYLGRMAESWKSILTYIGFFLTAYLTYKAFLEEWIKAVLK